MPEISVAIPTHNRCNLLAQTLNCVRYQRDVDIEIIVVDDGSSDKTTDQVRALGDDRVRLLRNDRAQGVSAARNKAVAHASGEWIAFLDDDDLWARNKLKRQVEGLRVSGAGWSHCGHVTIDNDLKVVAAHRPLPAKRILREVLYRNVVCGGASTVVVHRGLLDAEEPFHTGIKHMADWDLWIRLAQHGPPVVIDEPLVACRIHAGNASNESSTIPREIRVMEERHKNLLGGAKIDRAYVYRWIAWNSLRCGRTRDALGAYLLAVVNGDFASLGRAAVALGHPAAAFKVKRRSSVDASWISQAEAWLRLLSNN